MAPPSSFDAALERIVSFFEASPQRVFQRQELHDLLGENREKWRLAPSMSGGRFVTAMSEKTKLRAIQLESSYGAIATRFLWGEPSAFALGLSLRRGSYLSHGTASYLHELTDEVPKLVYVNAEQSPKPRPTGGLTQAGIDRAYSNKQRESKLWFSYDVYRVLILNGMNTGQLEVGVVARTSQDGSVEDLRVTKLERTLIDLAVRPSYGGGIVNVLEAYRRAKARLSMNTLIATLKKLAYIYPFHQSIGFYMERAGYEPDKLERLREFGLQHDFYLAYGLKAPHYDSRWRIRYPEGI